MQTFLTEYAAWRADRAELAEVGDSRDWQASDASASSLLEEAAGLMSQAAADQKALDDIAVGLGTLPEWGSDELEWIPDVIATVRPHPGDAGDTYLETFVEATGRRPQVD